MLAHLSEALCHLLHLESICTFNVHYKPSVHTGYNNQQKSFMDRLWITDGKNVYFPVVTLTFL